MKLLLSVFMLFSAVSLTYSKDIPVNIPELTDNNPETYYSGKKGKNQLVFEMEQSQTILSYSIYSSGESPEYDPVSWVLKGSVDGKKWKVIDERKEQKFCSRFQEVLCMVKSPGSYKKYMVEAAAGGDNPVKIADVVLSEKNMLAGWENFKYPDIDFESLTPDTEGSKMYDKLVQDPDEYIKYHARKVAEILYFSDQDQINHVSNIRYTLEDKNGVSAKGGNTPKINIFYSSQHVEKSAKESLYKLDNETRGVLYHELVHGYQYEPKNCGSYGNNRTFWACIEGIADAVRAESGFFDMSTRKPGGDWLDGYRTTGFFIQWLTTKDPDAIRKFHATTRDLEVWTFDAAIKSIFGPESTIELVWEEYQQDLRRQSRRR